MKHIHLGAMTGVDVYVRPVRFLKLRVWIAVRLMRFAKWLAQLEFQQTFTTRAERRKLQKEVSNGTRR